MYFQKILNSREQWTGQLMAWFGQQMQKEALQELVFQRDLGGSNI